MSAVEKPLFQNPSPPRAGKQLAEDVLSTFFLACDSARTQARGQSVGLDGFTANDATFQARRVWTLLSTARVFVINPYDFGKCYRRADQYTCESAGLGWDDLDGTPDEHRHLYQVYKDLSEKIPFPEKLPFDSVFLGFGKQLALSEFQTIMRITEESVRSLGITKASFYGYILGTSGDRSEAYAVIDMQGRRVNGVGFVCTYSNAKDIPGYGQDDWPSFWLQPANLDPWVIPMLIDAIDEKKNIRVERPGLGAKMMRKSVLKRSKGGSLPLPMPYYCVTLKDSFAEEAIQRFPFPGRSIAYSHRWDVRGHDCVRVAKGKLPLDPRIATKLKKRGYAIYDIQPIATEHFEILKKRDLRRGPDEWIAVLVYRREAYVKGPADKPYVPATRILI